MEEEQIRAALLLLLSYPFPPFAAPLLLTLFFLFHSSDLECRSQYNDATLLLPYEFSTAGRIGQDFFYASTL
jgi:hypothetical protein